MPRGGARGYHIKKRGRCWLATGVLFISFRARNSGSWWWEEGKSKTKNETPGIDQ